MTQHGKRLAFALEHSLGHTTHAQNLKRALAERDGAEKIDPVYIDLAYNDFQAPWTRLPGVRSNWSARASLGAFLALRRELRQGRLDGALFHTQVTALFSTGLMRRVPSVVSLDATPIQIDSLGAHYNHAPSKSERLEQIKKRLNERAYAAAQGLVTWSEWAKASLVADYGVPADKVTVIPPGVDRARWSFPERVCTADDTVRFLFVGGDFARKGGDTLLAAFHLLPEGIRRRCHLDIVTRDAVAGVSEGASGVSIHRGLAPNSPELISLFGRADVFVFPTRGDCLPLAVMEAMMAGLPVITTAVGALPEAVVKGEAGEIVPPDDAAALAEAMETLAGNTALRTALGRRARILAEERFDSATNYRRLVELVAGVAAGEGRKQSVVRVMPRSITT